MYLYLTCKVTIGQYVLRGVNSIEIKKSVHSLVQTAKIVLPLSVVFRNKDLEIIERVKLADKIKEGDFVRLEFGYNGDNKNEFEGYIKRINYKMPLEIECEDALYLLRKIYFKESYKNTTAKTLMQKALDKLKAAKGTDIKLYDKAPLVTIDNFYPNKEGNSNGVWLLEELRKFGVNTFLTKINNVATLFAGLVYDLRKGNVKYVFNTNTISNDDLKFELGEEKKIKIVVNSIDKNGIKHKETFGDEGGTVEEIKMNTASKSLMQQKAKSRLAELMTSGYKGSIETFLIPYCEPGMIAEVKDPQFPERAGRYYVGTVTTTFDTSGGRRKPELEIRLR